MDCWLLRLVEKCKYPVKTKKTLYGRSQTPGREDSTKVTTKRKSTRNRQYNTYKHRIRSKPKRKVRCRTNHYSWMLVTIGLMNRWLSDVKDRTTTLRRDEVSVTKLVMETVIHNLRTSRSRGVLGKSFQNL